MKTKRDLAGAPERRNLSSPLEVRAQSDDELILEGYASVFDAPYDIWGGPEHGGFTETIDQRAFNRTLSNGPDLHLLVNHEGLPLARTKSGTLDLSVDDHGLKVRAVLDRRDPDVQRLAVKMERGDMDEMSFAFRVPRGGDEWNDDDTQRRILDIDLNKGDVSVVNFGANPATSTTLQGAIRALANAADDELAEVRGVDDDILAAQRTLSRVIRDSDDAPKTLSLADARRLCDEPGI